MSVLGFIQVALDGAGKRIHNVLQNVSGDDRYQQIIALGDPDSPFHIAAVTDAIPSAVALALVVRTPPANYDSGMVALPSSLTALTGTGLRVRRIFLANVTSQTRKVTVADGGGKVYLQDHPIPPNDFLNLDMGGLQFGSGVQWNADVAASVNGQIVGDQ